MTHYLKIQEWSYNLIVQGLKRYTIRKHDRPFEVGDTVIFKRIDDETEYAGDFTIKYILEHWEFPDGIQKGYCILNF